MKRIAMVGMVGDIGLSHAIAQLAANGIEAEIISPDEAAKNRMPETRKPIVLEITPPEIVVDNFYTPDRYNNRAGRRKNKRK